MIRALLFSACALLPAQSPAPSPAPKPGHGMERLAQKLNLTEDQQARIKAIHQRQRAQMQARQPELKARHQALREAMKDPKTSESELRRRFDAVNDLRFQRLLSARQSRQEIRSVLTPEQQAQADALREQFRSRVRARMRERLERRLQKMDAAPAN